MQEEKFTFPILTVDGVIFQMHEGKLSVLIIQRGYEPFKDAWALPGGYIPTDETSRIALDRVLIQKTGIETGQLDLIEQPYAFDEAGRDPRGYAVTIMYIGLGKDLPLGTHSGMTKNQNPQFRPVLELPKLAYDHARIVEFAYAQLKDLASSTNAVGSLLPKTFTLTELQTTYEAIFNKQLDKRNFRKKILALELLEETGDINKAGAHRPARLYKFRNTNLQSLSQTF